MDYRAFIYRNKIHHLFFWLMLYLLWFYLRYDDYATISKALLVTTIKVADLALLVYLTNYIFIPRLLYRKQYGLFIIVLISLILISSITKMFILGWVIDNPVALSTGTDLKQRFYDNVVPHFFLVTSGAAIKLMVDYMRMQQRMTEMAKEKAEAELNFLKSQINPHFLFNTLNSVYFLIDKSNAAARNALHTFSGMLRYQLYEMNGDKLPVEKEIEFLKDYIELQKLRLDESCKVEYNYSPDTGGFMIEPLLLIPFVENAFKHISHRQETGFIKLHLDYRNTELIFSIVNSKDAGLVNTTIHGGIGLENVRKRLLLLYPGKHSLEIKDENGIYEVDLKLKIKN